MTGGNKGKAPARSPLAPALPPTPPQGELLRPVYVGRLETVADWRRQIGKVYREMRKGTLRPEDGTKLAFVANLGAQLAKVEQELREVAVLREEIARLQGGQQASPRLLQHEVPEWLRGA